MFTLHLALRKNKPAHRHQHNTRAQHYVEPSSAPTEFNGEIGSEEEDEHDYIVEAITDINYVDVCVPF